MTATPTTARLITELRERRRREAHERAIATIARETAARQDFVKRAHPSHEALITTMRTLRALGQINLDDLLVPPGFNLLDDGEVGSVNTNTPEWQSWSFIDQLRDQAEHLADVLSRVENELALERWWDA